MPYSTVATMCHKLLRNFELFHKSFYILCFIFLKNFPRKCADPYPNVETSHHKICKIAVLYRAICKIAISYRANCKIVTHYRAICKIAVGYRTVWKIAVYYRTIC